MAAQRYRTYLRQRYRVMWGYTGLMCLVSGLLILSPLVLLPFFPREGVLAGSFLWPGLLLSAGGLVLWRALTPPHTVSLTWQEGAVIVVLSWVLSTVVGAIPFILAIDLNFTQAIFEATSGWTTTGLSVVDVAHAPQLILFYRSVLQLAGGAGFAIIMLSALSGPAGAGLSAAEGRSDLLLPHVRQSAQLVLSMYSGYVAAGTAALWLAGMNWFDALNHAFAALSTGGFSTHPESIGYWDSPLLEGVVIVLMILGSLNFVTGYALFRGKLRATARNGEVKQEVFLTLLFTLVILFGVTVQLYPDLQKEVRVAIFETVTNLTTTGFATVDYRPWNGLGWLSLVLLMLIGGGSGSTAGGIKQYRIYALYRGLVWEVRRMFLPANTLTEPDVWQGENRQFLSSQNLSQVSLYIFLHMTFFFIGSGILAAHGYSLKESLFEFASALSTVGTSVGVTAPDAAPGVLWTEIAGMFLGRLEFYTVVVGTLKLAADGWAMLRPE
ncbi:MAG: TrkH family potassium uptake protein [Caldilineae bacterium]|nr:MAG: TrkH family potassium uptake protein [Caldilineae bacterium]